MSHKPALRKPLLIDELDQALFEISRNGGFDGIFEELAEGPDDEDRRHGSRAIAAALVSTLKGRIRVT